MIITTSHVSEIKIGQVYLDRFVAVPSRSHSCEKNLNDITRQLALYVTVGSFQRARYLRRTRRSFAVVSFPLKSEGISPRRHVEKPRLARARMHAPCMHDSFAHSLTHSLARSLALSFSLVPLYIFLPTQTSAAHVSPSRDYVPLLTDIMIYCYANASSTTQ